MGRWAALSIISVISCLHSHFGKGELTRLFHPAKDDSSLALLAVGDWGRNGTFNQTLVSRSMGVVGEDLDVDFVISVGDNFYESGLADVDDQSFQHSFTNIYTATSLQKQWYTVLGNHDYRGNVLAQLDPILRVMDSRWFCMRSFVVDAEIANFFFLDTTPFVKKYWKHPKKNHYDWREVAPRKTYISTLLKDLRTALAESAATWKIVIGHHTLRSVSEHGETPELVKLLLPMLIVSNYFSSFWIKKAKKSKKREFLAVNYFRIMKLIYTSMDMITVSSTSAAMTVFRYNLEQKQLFFIQFLTSGGGSKAWRGIVVPTNENLRFFYDGQGFVSLQLGTTDALIKFYDVFGAVLHEWSIAKEIYDYVV